MPIVLILLGALFFVVGSNEIVGGSQNPMDLIVVAVGICFWAIGLLIHVITIVVEKQTNRQIKAVFRISNPLFSEVELEELWNARKEKFLNP